MFGELQFHVLHCNTNKVFCLEKNTAADGYTTKLAFTNVTDSAGTPVPGAKLKLFLLTFYTNLMGTRDELGIVEMQETKEILLKPSGEVKTQ